MKKLCIKYVFYDYNSVYMYIYKTWLNKKIKSPFSIAKIPHTYTHKYRQTYRWRKSGREFVEMIKMQYDCLNDGLRHKIVVFFLILNYYVDN